MDVWKRHGFVPIADLAKQGIHLFLPVITVQQMTYKKLMAMVRNGSKKGHTYLKPAAVEDLFNAPGDLYYIYDVEDGSSTCGKSPEAAEKIFKQQSRSPLTAAEVVNLCILTNVLFKHGVWATGSRFDFVDSVPVVYLNDGDRPKLHWNYLAYSYVYWGSASCLRPAWARRRQDKTAFTKAMAGRSAR